MEQTIIDEKLKAYLAACLVAGIDVVAKPDIFMSELVDHLNGTERIFYAQGDEDGIILHDKHDLPLLYMIYDGQKLSFRVFEDSGYISGVEPNQEIGLALLNVLGYFRDKDLQFVPSILGSQRQTVASFIDQDDTSTTSAEDWAL